MENKFCDNHQSLDIIVTSLATNLQISHNNKILLKINELRFE